MGVQARCSSINDQGLTKKSGPAVLPCARATNILGTPATSVSPAPDQSLPGVGALVVACGTPSTSPVSKLDSCRGTGSFGSCVAAGPTSTTN